MNSQASLTRRALISSAAISPLVTSAALAADGQPPPYTLSVNIEIMFPKSMPRDRRMEAVAAHGMKAYSFWTAPEEERSAMLAVQERTGLKCASIVGSGKPGRSTGLTKPGFEQAYLDAITENCEIAKRFGGPDLIIFIGEMQKTYRGKHNSGR